jgi:hypothetical protein
LLAILTKKDKKKLHIYECTHDSQSGAKNAFWHFFPFSTLKVLPGFKSLNCIQFSQFFLQSIRTFSRFFYKVFELFHGFLQGIRTFSRFFTKYSNFFTFFTKYSNFFTETGSSGAYQIRQVSF